MNITESIEDRAAEQARQAALAIGMSLEPALHDQPEHLASRAQLETEIAAWLQAPAHSAGRLDGWTFNRDALQRSE
jgi:hypothetical protein